MDPLNDIIPNLLETPFHQRKDKEKNDILHHERPTNPLTICAKKELKKCHKSYNINFKSGWFTNYTWLCSSIVLQKLFCWPCLLLSTKNSVWNKEGFADLLNITRALHKHADSMEHIKCELMLRNLKKNQNTIAEAVKENARILKIQYNENIRLNRLFFRTVINAVLYLSKQNLSFHGHDESVDSVNQGNFKELLNLLIENSPLEIQNHYEKIQGVFTGDCKNIKNELIECISEYLNDYVKNEIKNSNFFSIQVDDITDISPNSQCCVIIRFVNLDGRLVERFLGFYDVNGDRTSEALYNLLDKILDQFDYQHKLIGQCYDGAIVMSEHLSGLKQKMKDKCPRAVLVHCLEQHLNLVLQQSLGKFSACRMFFATLGEIPHFFHHFANRSQVLTSTSSRFIPTLTETQWYSTSKLLSVMVEDWDTLKEVFKFIKIFQQSDKRSIQLAKGFLNDMNSFEFTFLAIIFNDIFHSTDILFDVLQKNSLDVNYCISEIKKECEILRNKRNDEFFNTVFNKAAHVTELNSEQKYSTLIEECRILYFEILDHILIEMDLRFQDCEKLKFFYLIDSTKFKEYQLSFPHDALENLEQFYGPIFSKIRLRNELNNIYADVNYYNKSAGEVLQQLHEIKDIFTETYKLFSLVMTIPSTNVSVERSFSCLKHIKTCCKNAMIQEKFALNISIQKELLMDIMRKHPFYEDITDKFASSTEQGLDLIYKT